MLKMQIISNFVWIIGIWMKQKQVGDDNIYKSAIRKVTTIT